MNHLWLVRHAKASDRSAPRDFDRPLARRGRKDGAFMQGWFAEQSSLATWIWSSDAVRALETAEFVRAGFDVSAKRLVAVHELYSAAADVMLQTLRGTPAEVRSVALVGHNPGTVNLVNLLAGERVVDQLPTFGVAQFEVPEDWTSLDYGLGKFKSMNTPKTV